MDLDKVSRMRIMRWRGARVIVGRLAAYLYVHRARRSHCPLDGQPCTAGIAPRACLKADYPLCK